MILTTAIAFCLAAPADSVTMNFVASGATRKAGGYRPIRCEVGSSEFGIKAKPADLKSPRFGKLELNGRSVAIILDEPAGQPGRLFVDANGDGDLTKDEVKWSQNANKMYSGAAMVDIGKGAPASINLYRFDPNDPARAALKNTVLYYGDYGYEVNLTIDGKTTQAFVAGDPGAGTSIGVDRNGDNQISAKLERVTVGKPFNFFGTTFVLQAKNGSLELEKSAEKLPVAPMPPSFGIGKKALNFTATDMTGKKVNFPGDYKGKVVLLDFWATWCGPCIAELPNVKKAYAAHHEKGFEILGISFDQKDMADKVSKFAVENGMPWRHIYEGKFWDTDLGTLYDVSGIPFVLLVDGDTGEILAMSNTLRGPQIVDTVAKALAAKTAQ